MPFHSSDEKGKLQRRCSDYWSKVPDDLKIEILCRLPTKALMRLKCVSKSWYFLISNSCAPLISSSLFYGLFYIFEILDFGASLGFSVDMEVESLQNCPAKFGWGVLSFLESFMPFLPSWRQFQDCCEGLLLFHHFEFKQYTVCNPTTYECITVSVNLDHYHNINKCAASLIYDPRVSPNSFMIIVPREFSNHSLTVDVFSTCLGNWCSYKVHLDYVVNGSNLIDRGVYLNGVLYMLSLDKYFVCICLAPTQDKKTNTCGMMHSRTIELPGKDEFDCCGSFGASRGSLVYSNSDKFKIKVWVLQDGFNWVLKHTISIEELIGHPQIFPGTREYCNSGGLLKVNAFHPYTEQLFLANHCEIHKYNPITKELERFKKLSNTRTLVCGQYKMFDLTRCVVIFNSVINNQQL